MAKYLLLKHYGAPAPGRRPMDKWTPEESPPTWRSCRISPTGWRPGEFVDADALSPEGTCVR